MPEPISNKFYDLLRLHLETGTDYRYMRFSAEQKKRISVCVDAYKQLEINPYLNIREYLKNRHGRTMSEMYNDNKVIDFITSVCQAGGKNISRMRVRKNAELAMKMGYDQGNTDAMLKAGKQLMDIDELNKPDTGGDMEEDITKLPIAFTNDARKLFPNKGHSSDEQMEKIRQKWGVKKDRIQEMVERKVGEYVAKEADEQEEVGNDMPHIPLTFAVTGSTEPRRVQDDSEEAPASGDLDNFEEWNEEPEDLYDDDDE